MSTPITEAAHQAACAEVVKGKAYQNAERDPTTALAANTLKNLLEECQTLEELQGARQGVVFTTGLMESRLMATTLNDTVDTYLDSVRRTLGVKGPIRRGAGS